MAVELLCICYVSAEFVGGLAMMYCVMCLCFELRWCILVCWFDVVVCCLGT